MHFWWFFCSLCRDYLPFESCNLFLKVFECFGCNSAVRNVEWYLDGWCDCLTIAFIIGWWLVEEWGCSDIWRNNLCCFALIIILFSFSSLAVFFPLGELWLPSWLLLVCNRSQTSHCINWFGFSCGKIEIRSNSSSSAVSCRWSTSNASAVSAMWR